MKDSKMSGWLRSMIRKSMMSAVCFMLLIVMFPAVETVSADEAVTDLELTKTRIRELEGELAHLRAKLRVQAGQAGYLPRVDLPDPVADITPVDDDGERYLVTELLVQYARSHAGHPPLEDVLGLEIDLLRTESGFVSPRAGEASVAVRLMDLQGVDNVYLHGSALRKIAVTIVGYFNELGIIGVFVGPEHTQINQRGEDIRSEGDTSLRLIIRTAVVAEMRSLASGERVPVGQRINNPMHGRILRGMPIKPSDGYRDNDLLDKGQLDRYVSRLNRHPGRRVDVAISAADDAEPGAVALDLLVTENKPWLAYFQLSNTGTQSTTAWRERFGFTHYQLTGRDDVISLDYITSGFDNAHSIVGSYEAPLGGSDWLRWRVDGSWSNFSSNDVGFANERFIGRSWKAGGSLIANVYNRDNRFIDVFGGLEYNEEFINNELIGTRGRADFVWATIGAKYQRRIETSSTFAQLSLKFNISELANTSTSFDSITGNNGGLGFLGRSGRLEDDPFIASWFVSHSFYLEPLWNRASWNDPSTPKTSTLAHEIYVSTSGQNSFDARLIPQETRTVGGMYSVRGYQESEVSGDDAYIFSAEYRVHVPRLFAIQPDPSKTPLLGKPFRWAPQTVYGRTDWDVILKGFFDYAHTVVHNNPTDAAEANEDLMSLGMGVEFLLKRNLSVRADWGVALTDGNETQSGDTRFHLAATVLY